MVKKSFSPFLGVSFGAHGHIGCCQDSLVRFVAWFWKVGTMLKAPHVEGSPLVSKVTREVTTVLLDGLYPSTVKLFGSGYNYHYVKKANHIPAFSHIKDTLWRVSNNASVIRPYKHILQTRVVNTRL